MYCRSCGEQINDNAAICLKCGAAVGSGKKYCANCGATVNENAAICLSCGCAIENKVNSNSLNGQNKVTIALVCFFFGFLGIHNFMMGETKRGIIKIVFSFLCGIGEILALIDLIKILSNTYQVQVG